jgi:hypothetical protein
VKDLTYFDITFLGVPRTQNQDCWIRFFYFAQEEGYSVEKINEYLNGVI